MPAQIVPFIVLSKNKTLLGEFLAEKNTGSMLNFITKYRDYTDGIRRRAANTVSIQVFDPSLIESFEHTFGFSTGGFDSASTSVIEVTFLDPAYDLENYLINSLYSVDTVIPKAPKFSDVDLKSGPKPVVGIKEGQEIDAFVKQRGDELRDIVAGTQFTPYEDGGNTQLYWVAYGVGFNSCDWSNPLSVQRKSVEIKADGTSGRKVKLIFVPHPPEKFRSKDVVKNLDYDWVSDRVRETILVDGTYKLISRKQIDLFNPPKVDDPSVLGSIGLGLAAAGAAAAVVATAPVSVPLTIGGAAGAGVAAGTSDSVKETFLGTDHLGNTRTDFDNLYVEIIDAIYNCIYEAYKVSMFGNDKEKHNIILFLPNYRSHFRKLFDDIKERKGLREKDKNAAFDLVTEFLGALGGPVKLIAEKDHLKDVSQDVDAATKEATDNSEKSALKIFSEGFRFYISISLTDKINPQADLEKIFLALHQKLRLFTDIDGKPDINDGTPQYVFFEENNVKYINLMNENLNRKVVIYGGNENPLVEGGNVITKEFPAETFYLVGSKKLIDKYFYFKNPITGFPINYNGGTIGKSSVVTDLGEDMWKLGFDLPLYDKIAEYQASLPASQENSIFGDLYKIPTKTYTELTLGSEVIENFFGKKPPGKTSDQLKKIDEVVHKAKVPVFNLGLDGSNVLELNMDLDRVYQSIWMNDYGYARKLLGVKALFSKDSDFKSSDFKRFNEILDLVKANKIEEVRSKIKESEKSQKRLFLHNAVITMNVMGTKATVKGADVLNHAGAEGFPIDNKNADDEVFTKYAAAHGTTRAKIEQRIYDSMDVGSGKRYMKDNDFSLFANFVGSDYENRQIDFIVEVLKDLAGVIKSNPTVILPSDSAPFTPINLHKDITSLALSMPLVGKIKTLPYFGLSDYKSTIKTPCFLFGAEPVALFAGNNIRLSPGRFWFNGIYVIVGYKHTINRNNVYSEFAIMRHGG